MVTHGSLLEALAQLLASRGVNLAAWGLAFARVAPVLAIVPAFGLRALSPPTRASIALLLSLLVLPAVRPGILPSLPLPVLLLTEIMRGTVVALGAAIPLWIATMVGGLVDTLRGSQDAVTLPTIEGRTTWLGALFALLAGAIFLGTGGPAHVVALLATAPVPWDRAVVRTVADLAAGIGIAVAIAAPLLAASVILEIAGALVAGLLTGADAALLAPIRSLALLCLTALLFERIASFLALSLQR